jgi:hypothetical protein
MAPTFGRRRIAPMQSGFVLVLADSLIGVGAAIVLILDKRFFYEKKLLNI